MKTFIQPISGVAYGHFIFDDVKMLRCTPRGEIEVILIYDFDYRLIGATRGSELIPRVKIVDPKIEHERRKKEASRSMTISIGGRE